MNDDCPICLEDFHGRDVAAVAVKPVFLTQCGHRYHVDCITQLFLEVAIDRRRCAYCRGDPFPVKNLKTGESHQVKFFPDMRFYYACADGNQKQVFRALAEGVNVNAVMKEDTPLMLASNEGDEMIVDHLLKAGADVNATRIKDGVTALMMAAQRGRTNCVKRLLNAGANRKIPKTSDGATPLSIAVSRGYVECVELLIKDEADLNTRFKDGNTLLLITACKDIMELLIKNGADVNAARTSDGATPLSIAIEMDNIDCALTLIKAKAPKKTNEGYCIIL